MWFRSENAFSAQRVKENKVRGIMRNSLPGIFFALMAGCAPSVSHAYSLGATKLILPQQPGQVDYQAVSTGKDPAALVQVRLSATPDGDDPVPYAVVSPPLFRLAPAGRNAVRIRLRPASAGGVPLPADRESVFYVTTAFLPASPVPFKSSQTGPVNTGASVTMSLAFRTPVFYRPAGLAAPTQKTYQQVTFTRVPGGVRVQNPTPYYLDVKAMTIGGQPVKRAAGQSRLIPPMSSQIYGVTGAVNKSAPSRSVSYTVANDFGGGMTYEATVR